MNNSVIFQDFKYQNNMSLIAPNNSAAEKKGKFSPLSAIIPLGTGSVGALGGFLNYKLKEKPLLSQLEKDSFEYKKTLAEAFEKRPGIQDSKKLISSLQESIDSMGKTIAKGEITDTVKITNLQQLLSRQTESLQSAKKSYDDKMTKDILEPLNKFVDERLAKISKTKKTNILIGVGIGVAAGAAIILTKYFVSKKDKTQ